MGERPKKTAFESALGYLSLRDAPLKTIREYLQKKGFSQEEIEGAAEKLMEHGIVKEGEYAKRFVETHPSAGPRLLRQKLRQKGLSDEDTRAALEEIGPEEEAERAFKLLCKKLGEAPSAEALQKGAQTLLRRGFSYAAARSAAKRLGDETLFEEE
ncbi:MAG: recombination regulator RecX [Christensenellaceae bacterium]|jgi:regulatory protein|nr:recombination regulator RecX [Christensenellaceae bacterium]